MVWQSEGGKQYNISEKENGRFWYLNNKLHRELGPAIENSGGGSWWYEGTKIACSSQKEFEKIIKLKKEAAAQKWFDVKVETLVPATITHRIFAKTPEEAIEKSKTTPPRSIQYKLPAKKDRKITVYDAGLTIIRLVKNLLG
jgi:hypothetical protein